MALMSASPPSTWVRCHGEAAEREAMLRAEKFRQANDHHGADVWTAIARVIHQGAHASVIEKDPARDIEDRPTA